MIIHVYSVCHNEETLLPFFLRHYGSIATRIIVYDDASTDNSRKILESHPKAVHRCLEHPSKETAGRFSESALMRVRNDAYKESRLDADWVIVADIDEILFHPELRRILAEYSKQGVNLPAVTGFEMVGERIVDTGEQIYETMQHGFRNPLYDKRVIFSPDLEINYGPGCHSCSPQGGVRESRDNVLKLLHYRFVGVDHFVRKYSLRQSRMTDESASKGWGTHLTVPGKGGVQPIYPAEPEEIARRYRRILEEQVISKVI